LALFELQGPRSLPGEGTEKCARDHIIEKHSLWVLDQFAETIQSECKWNDSACQQRRDPVAWKSGSDHSQPCSGLLSAGELSECSIV